MAKKTHYRVEVDSTRCSLCEACSHQCPTGALSQHTEGNALGLYHKPALCTGCRNRDGCEDVCPEDAAKVVTTAEPPRGNEVVVLVESEMLRCQYCKEVFAPERRVDKVSEKSETQDADRIFCPLCRRSNLIIDLIEHKNVPLRKNVQKGIAEYRSTNDILRRVRQKRAYLAQNPPTK